MWKKNLRMCFDNRSRHMFLNLLCSRLLDRIGAIGATKLRAERDIYTVIEYLSVSLGLLKWGLYIIRSRFWAPAPLHLFLENPSWAPLNRLGRVKHEKGRVLFDGDNFTTPLLFKSASVPFYEQHPWFSKRNLLASFWQTFLTYQLCPF